MTIHLTSSIARNIAEAAWGRGDTVAQRTTRRGAYFLTCDQGFGFVLDDACLSREERRAFAAFAMPRRATVLHREGLPPIYHHELKQRRRGYPATGKVTSAVYWLMGGDVLWTVPVLYAGIGLHGATAEQTRRFRARAAQEFQGAHRAAA